MNFLPYGRQSINRNDIDSVIKVLESAWITQGPKIEEFEKLLADYCGAKYAVAVSNGTAALHLACLSAGLKKGDEAITSPITFLATSNAVLYAGAKPVFADISSDTLNIDPDRIKKCLSKKTKAILPVHFAGLPCAMEEIQKTAKKYKLIVIEDAAHALGAKYKVNGQWFKVGCCRHSDMTILSFHPVKHITTGEGGAILTNSVRLYDQLKALRTHGMFKDEKTQKIGPWYYEMRELGFNYRITDFQCALGISQLQRIDQFIQRRREVAEKYRELLKEFAAVELIAESEGFSSYHLFVVRIAFKKLKKTRTQVMNQLKEKGVGTQVHYIPVYQQPFYKKLGCRQNMCPNAQKYYNEALSLPMFPDMTPQDVSYVVDSLKSVLS